MIAPRRARNALLEMQYQRAGIPWASELSVLDADWLGSRVERFVENNRYLAEQFTDPGDDDGPDQTTLNRASRAIREFADEMHDEISNAFWAREELAALAEASRRHLAPTLLSRMLDTIQPTS